MNRKSVEEAFKYFAEETRKAAGPYGDLAVYPHMQLACEACAARLDKYEQENRARQEAIQFFREEADRYRRAPEINGCPMTPEWERGLTMCVIAIGLLEEENNE